MQPADVKTVDDAKAIVEQRELDHVRVGLFDIDGAMRGKSFTRLIPGFWAPTAASWGIENRTCALRAIPGKEKSQRVEYRIAAADINPYIALSAALGSGLWGIENRVEPGQPVRGNAYDVHFDESQQLPATLFEAATALKESKAARELFGDAFIEHYGATREWEEREYRKHITDWEMNRYFEII